MVAGDKDRMVKVTLSYRKFAASLEYVKQHIFETTNKFVLYDVRGAHKIFRIGKLNRVEN